MVLHHFELSRLKVWGEVKVPIKMEEAWPFILPLPKEIAAQYKVLASAFSSEIALRILRRLRLDGKTYQKDLIQELSEHSNKSVLKYLGLFVNSGILEEGVERSSLGKRTVWVKWYKPTFIGRWLILLLTPREELSPEELKALIKELLSFYARSIVKLCLDTNLEPNYFKQLFDEAISSKMPAKKD